MSNVKTSLKWILLATLLVLTSACRGGTVLYAPPAVFDDLLVTVYDAKIKGDHVWVKMHVYNGGAEPVVVDRDGFALRLPNGQVLKRASGITTQHKPYTVAPRERRVVHVDFRTPDELAMAGDLFLIVGGIRHGEALVPRVAGEVPLVDNYDRIAPPPMTDDLDDAAPAVPVVVKTSAAPPEPPEPPPAAAAADEPAAPPAPPPPPPPPPAVKEHRTVAVDLSRLSDEAYERIKGVELEKQLIVRLVQDGFAVVAPSESPSALLFVSTDKERVVLRVEGVGGAASREIPDSGQDRGVLHHELVQKASSLVHEQVKTTNN